MPRVDLSARFSRDLDNLEPSTPRPWEVTMSRSFVIRWHLIIDISEQSYSHLGGIVSTKDVADIMSFHLHLYLIIYECSGPYCRQIRNMDETVEQ